MHHKENFANLYPLMRMTTVATMRRGAATGGLVRNLSNWKQGAAKPAPMEDISKEPAHAQLASRPA